MGAEARSLPQARHWLRAGSGSAWCSSGRGAAARSTVLEAQAPQLHPRPPPACPTCRQVCGERRGPRAGETWLWLSAAGLGGQARCRPRAALGPRTLGTWGGARARGSCCSVRAAACSAFGVPASAGPGGAEPRPTHLRSFRAASACSLLCLCFPGGFTGVFSSSARAVLKGALDAT